MGNGWTTSGVQQMLPTNQMAKCECCPARPCCPLPHLPLPFSVHRLKPQKISARYLRNGELEFSFLWSPYEIFGHCCCCCYVAVAVVYCFVCCCCRCCCCCCCFVLLHIGRKVKAKAARRMRRIKNVACHLNFFLLKFV